MGGGGGGGRWKRKECGRGGGGGRWKRKECGLILQKLVNRKRFDFVVTMF